MGFRNWMNLMMNQWFLNIASFHEEFELPAKLGLVVMNPITRVIYHL